MSASIDFEDIWYKLDKLEKAIWDLEEIAKRNEKTHGLKCDGVWLQDAAGNLASGTEREMKALAENNSDWEIEELPN